MNKKQTQLIQDFLEVRELEERYRKDRIAIEEKLAKSFPTDEEKQTTIKDDSYEITVDRTYSYKLDDELYRKAAEKIPEEYQCHRVKLELDKRKYADVMDNAPKNISNMISDCVEKKPKKVSIKIKVL